MSKESACHQISIDLFNVDVSVFTSEKARHKALKAEGCKLHGRHGACIASAHMDRTKEGYPRLSMVIKPEASVPTWAHECSHIADYVCDAFGLPISLEATEIRAYIIGHLMAGLEEIFLGPRT